MQTIIFSNTTVFQLLELFFWILGAFLIGLYFGRIIGKNAKRKNPGVYEDIAPNESLDLTHDISKIRATKTFERGGYETIKTVIKPIENQELNFNSIGKATIDEKDNLTQIKGIGPAIEKELNKIGIYTFKQISNFNVNDIIKITDLIKFFPGRIERDDWVGQAFKLNKEDK